MIFFRESIKVTNSYLIYMPVLALSNLMVLSESTRVYALLSGLLSFIVYPIIYGSVIEKIKKVEQSSWSDLLTDYFAKYFGLALIFGIPVLILTSLYSGMNYLNKNIANVLTGTAVQCVALYAWPLLFLKKRIFDSIHGGFVFLIHKPMKSLLLILLIVLTSIIKLLATLSPVFIFHSMDLGLVYGIGYLHNIINVYLDLIIFSMATMRLLKDW